MSEPKPRITRDAAAQRWTIQFDDAFVVVTDQFLVNTDTTIEEYAAWLQKRRVPQ